MSSESLRTAMFMSVNIMMLVSYILFELWEEDIARRSAEVAELTQKLQDALSMIEHIESQSCELDLDVCRIQSADLASSISKCYEDQSNLKICYKNLEKCQYETIELSSECGI